MAGDSKTALLPLFRSRSFAAARHWYWYSLFRRRKVRRDKEGSCVRPGEHIF